MAALRNEFVSELLAFSFSPLLSFFCSAFSLGFLARELFGFARCVRFLLSQLFGFAFSFCFFASRFLRVGGGSLLLHSFCTGIQSGKCRQCVVQYPSRLFVEQ